MCFVFLFFASSHAYLVLHSFPTRRSSDLYLTGILSPDGSISLMGTSSLASSPRMRTCTSGSDPDNTPPDLTLQLTTARSEEHTSELQSLRHLVCRLLLEKKKNKKTTKKYT